MLKILKEDFIYNFVNNTVFMLATILATIYLSISVHNLNVDNDKLNNQITELSLHVKNIDTNTTKLGYQLQTSLSAESVVLAKMADEVKAQQVTLDQAQKDNRKMIKQLKALKHELKMLERHHKWDS